MNQVEQDDYPISNAAKQVLSIRPQEYQDAYAEIRKLAANQVVEMLKETAFTTEPKDSFSELLELLDEEQVEDLAEVFHSEFMYADEFPEDKTAFILNFIEENPELLMAYLSDTSSDFYELFMKVLESGGKLAIAKDDIRSLALLEEADPPYLFLFFYDDTITVVIPREFVNLIEKLDASEISELHRITADIGAYAHAYVEMTGLISIDELYSLYTADNDPIPQDEFEEYLVDSALKIDSQYAIYDIDLEPYVVHLSIYPEHDENVASQNEFKEFLAFLKNAQSSHQRKVLSKEEVLSFDAFSEFLLKPTTVKLWDLMYETRIEHEYYLYADEMLRSLFDNNRLGVDQESIRDLFRTPEIFLDKSDYQKLVSLARLAVVNMPTWLLNGWSQVELEEEKTGKKSFYDDEGLKVSVGRNDPCPCGSGKKYKKCCGR